MREEIHHKPPRKATEPANGRTLFGNSEVGQAAGTARAKGPALTSPDPTSKRSQRKAYRAEKAREAIRKHRENKRRRAAYVGAAEAIPRELDALEAERRGG